MALVTEMRAWLEEEGRSRVPLMKRTGELRSAICTLEKTGGGFRATVPGSLNAPGRTESNWASAPKLTLEEQNQRAADFHRQQSERRARAAEEYVERIHKIRRTPIRQDTAKEAEAMRDV